MMRKCILVCGLMACLSACHPDDKFPKDVLTVEEMQPVMWDLFAAGELKISDTASAVRLHLKDSITSLFNYALRVHHVNRDTFLHSFKYYEMHPDKQLILIDSLAAYNDRLVKLYEKKYHIQDSLRREKEGLSKQDTVADKSKTPVTPAGAPVSGGSADTARSSAKTLLK